jgi:hypothetical protein
MLHIDAGFEKLLGAHTVAELDAEHGSVVGLWPDGRIAFLNSAWRRFAEQNEGAEVIRRWPLGSDFLLGISGELRDYYARALAGVRAGGEPWEQSYGCYAPCSRCRFRLRVLRLDQGALLLIHSLAVDEPVLVENDVESERPVLSDYVGPRGLVRQCSNCRRTRRVSADCWDWVRAFVEHPPNNVSHGICALCLRQDYPELWLSDRQPVL